MFKQLWSDPKSVIKQLCCITIYQSNLHSKILRRRSRDVDLNGTQACLLQLSPVIDIEYICTTLCYKAVFIYTYHISLSIFQSDSCGQGLVLGQSNGDLSLVQVHITILKSPLNDSQNSRNLGTKFSFECKACRMFG